MPDITSITGAIGSLKTAHETVKAMVEARDTAVFQSKAIELQTQILAAQSSALAAQSDQQALLQRVSELEEKITTLEAWNAEKERYALCEIKDRRFAYALKEEMRSGEPKHYLCANCYENKRKSILQHESRLPGRASLLVCHHCGSEIYLMGERRSEHSRATPRKR